MKALEARKLVEAYLTATWDMQLAIGIEPIAKSKLLTLALTNLRSRLLETVELIDRLKKTPVEYRAYREPKTGKALIAELRQTAAKRAENYKARGHKLTHRMRQQLK